MTDDDPGSEDEDAPADPFDALDADEYRDRQGDPFGSLDDERRGDTPGADPGATGDRRGDKAGSDADPSPRSPTGDDRSTDRDADVTSDDPFADVDRGGESPFESASSAFDRIDVDGVDPDEVWERLAAGGSADAAAVPDEAVEVSKHAYCEGCEYFSSPPDIHCTHEGTEILEFVDMGTVRVVNCPVVAERRRLGREE